jgi:beta-glucanase (GH16 family)
VGWRSRCHPAPNNEAQYYSSDMSGSNCAFSLVDGNLNISAFPVSNGWYGLPYCSGLITTAKSFAITYGYIEARIKFPKGRGLWPGFWLYNVTVHDNTELDALELLGHETTRIYCTTHGPEGGVGQNFIVPDTSVDFHTYGVDWNPTTCVFYMDGKALGSAPTPSSMRDPMFILLNLAVGGAGSWPGQPDSATVFPAVMSVDYVRAYATPSTTYMGGSAALIPTGPALAVATNPIISLGNGKDVLVLVLSEDAYDGDAQFTISVDGNQIGGTQTVTARNVANGGQEFHVHGSFASGPHTITVNFLNDAWGGSPSTDRNLYLKSATLNGVPVPGGQLNLYSNGPQSVSFNATRTDPDTLIDPSRRGCLPR